MGDAGLAFFAAFVLRVATGATGTFDRKPFGLAKFPGKAAMVLLPPFGATICRSISARAANVYR